MSLTVVINGFGILINGSICFGMMIAFNKRSAASMPATDLQNILVSQIPAACHMMIQLNGRPVGFILRSQVPEFHLQAASSHN